MYAHDAGLLSFIAATFSILPHVSIARPFVPFKAHVGQQSEGHMLTVVGHQV